MKKSLLFATFAAIAFAAAAAQPPPSASTIENSATTAASMRADYQTSNQSTAATVSVAADKVVAVSTKKAGTEHMQAKKHVAPTAKKAAAGAKKAAPPTAKTNSAMTSVEMGAGPNQSTAPVSVNSGKVAGFASSVNGTSATIQSFAA